MVHLDYDLVLVIGLTLAILAIPSLLSAYSESRAPRAGAVMVLIAGVLVMVALVSRPTGYGFDEIPDVFLRVLKRYLG